jgi:hypothetical protein
MIMLSNVAALYNCLSQNVLLFLSCILFALIICFPVVFSVHDVPSGTVCFNMVFISACMNDVCTTCVVHGITVI